MQTDTLMKIRNELVNSPESRKSWTWEAKRLSRINQVLSGRGIKTTTTTMKEPEKKKERNVKHTPKSWTEKPQPPTRITQDEMDEAKRQAAKFLPK